MPIGNGLFCKERIQNGQQIVRFSGEPLRNRTEVQHARAVSQHGGYVITNHTETYGLDCFQAAARHQCFASKANSPYKCKNIYRGTFPEATSRRLARPQVMEATVSVWLHAGIFRHSRRFWLTMELVTFTLLITTIEVDNITVFSF